MDYRIFILSITLSVIIIVLQSIIIYRLKARVKTLRNQLAKTSKYKLEKKLGEGTMGVVYKAKHEMLQRPAAIKFLRSTCDNREAIKRFEREVRLSSRLTHPNTISIYDYGIDENGNFYYV